jgi:thiol-disulfide isomerase/thioredoxin
MSYAFLRPLVIGAAAAFLSVVALAGCAPKLESGLWDGAIMVEGSPIPFQFRVSEDGGGVQAVFFDGDRPINPSSKGSYQDDKLHLEFDTYATTLDATRQGGAFKGTYRSARWSFPIEVKPHKASANPAAEPGPAIAGDWIVESGGSAHENGWRLTIRQQGPKAYATILRIDGDTGTLSGTWRDGAWRLSHFAGERPVSADITPQANGTLKVALNDDDFGKYDLVARTPAAAEAAGVAPADPTRFTTVRDKNEVFRFAGKDLSGKTVTNEDPRFKGKVVLVNLTGSWCPNCHDEAPFLAGLYEKYRAQGLEIVGLDFEHADQIGNPWRLKAFLKKYGLTYTVLLVGQPSEVQEKLPQAVNLKAWPTSFFLGRDGKVRRVHVGFTSPGNASHDAALKAEITREIEALLAEKKS